MGIKKRTQIKLAGKLGICPNHLSEVKRGIADLGVKAARKAAKTLETGLDIWLVGADKKQIKARATAINTWCSQSTTIING